jgi:predicted methyltransferase
MITINDIVAASHLFVAQHVRRGDTVVDATAGNGHDTLFLARLVGAGGKVHAFDIQETALEKTRALLVAHTCEQWVELHLKDHGELAQVVEGPVQAAMFNLGYLPGGDKQITTHAHSSLRALANCLGVLAPGGIISVVTYSGHRGGEEEEAEVAGWCRSLPARDYTVVSFSLINKER